LKADAYGLDAKTVGNYLQDIGCTHFAAESVEDAIKLRIGGLKGELMVLSPIPSDRVADAAVFGLTVPLVSLSQAKRYSEAAKSANVILKGHIAADCGLTRFGVKLDDFDAAVSEAEAILSLPGLSVNGVYTHFTEASIDSGEELNRFQIELFEKYFKELRLRGFDICAHGASSFMAMAYPESHFDFVRVASFLWGIEPWPGRGPKPRQAVALRCRILQIKTVEKGTPIGYGPSVYAQRRTRIAVLPLGYADGLRRNMVGKIDLLVNGRRVPMIGKMYMDYTVIDVTDVCANEGDIVTVMGRDGTDEIKAGDLAAVYPGTVGEVLAVLNKRLPRVYE
jgi:alanine racemase